MNGDDATCSRCRLKCPTNHLCKRWLHHPGEREHCWLYLPSLMDELLDVLFCGKLANLWLIYCVPGKKFEPLMVISMKCRKQVELYIYCMYLWIMMFLWCWHASGEINVCLMVQTEISISNWQITKDFDTEDKSQCLRQFPDFSFRPPYDVLARYRSTCGERLRAPKCTT